MGQRGNLEILRQGVVAVYQNQLPVVLGDGAVLSAGGRLVLSAGGYRPGDGQDTDGFAAPGPRPRRGVGGSGSRGLGPAQQEAAGEQRQPQKGQQEQGGSPGPSPGGGEAAAGPGNGGLIPQDGGGGVILPIWKGEVDDGHRNSSFALELPL